MVPMRSLKVMMIFKKFHLYVFLVEIHRYFINHIKKLKMPVKFRSILKSSLRIIKMLMKNKKRNVPKK